MNPPGKLDSSKSLTWQHVPVEELVVGDTVRFWVGTVRIVALEPYTGPYDFIHGIARYEPKGAVSLEKGDTFETLRDGGAS